MNLMFQICRGLSIGVVLGVLCGFIKMCKANKPYYSNETIQHIQSYLKFFSTALKYLTLTALGLGFIWCMYFLLLAILIPQQAEYANNMAELIVSVLTIISIAFAFIEFLRRK